MADTPYAQMIGDILANMNKPKTVTTETTANVPGGNNLNIADILQFLLFSGMMGGGTPGTSSMMGPMNMPGSGLQGMGSLTGMFNGGPMALNNLTDLFSNMS